MAKASSHARVTVEIVPDIAGFKTSLQGEVVAAGIAAGWYALEKRMQIAYGVELNQLSRAIGRAEWLATSL